MRDSVESLRGSLLRIYQAALAAVEGGHRVRYALASNVLYDPVYVIAVGKAACAMARGAAQALGTRIRGALVVTKHGYSEQLPWPVLEAGHPLPDEASLAAGAALLQFVDAVPERSSVLLLLSGGTSALVEALPEGMSIAPLRELNAWLLASGRDISEMNAIRQRVSLIKGGRLAQRLYPRDVLCLAISDVAGDHPATIGSGPVSPVANQHHFNLTDAPAGVQRALQNPPAMPIPNDPCFQKVRFEIVARLADAKDAAARAAETEGFAAVLHPEFISGTAMEAGESLAQKLIQSGSRAVHIWGGEPTVRLPSKAGRGGRAQHMGLSAARVFAGHSNVALLVAATDGSDGNTDEAGAIVDGETVRRGEDAGHSALRALEEADSGRFLEAAGDLIQTGPTGTNVMDLMIGARLD